MANMQEQERLSVTLGNKARFPMRLERSHVWTGPALNFPRTLLPNGPATVTELVDKRSKAVCIYTGKNMSGFDCAWLCAWDAPTQDIMPMRPLFNKVFVMCGPKQMIDSLDYHQIEMRLDHSKSTSTFVDSFTKTCADANINSSSPNPIPFLFPIPRPQETSVVANFGLTP